jgi:hypothetical protein
MPTAPWSAWPWGFVLYTASISTPSHNSSICRGSCNRHVDDVILFVWRGQHGVVTYISSENIVLAQKHKSA